MSTTQTETVSHENSLSLRSPADNDNLSQESYSTVVDSPQSTSQNEGKGSDQGAKQSKDPVAKQTEDSDEDEEDPSPCGRCRKLVVRGDEAIMCEICSQWYHIKCERVTKGQYKQQATKTKSNFHWFCDTCDIIQNGLLRQMTLLNTEHGNFKKKLEDLEERKANKEDIKNLAEMKANKEDMERLEQRITTIEENQAVPGTSTQGKEANKNEANELMKEIRDQKSRICNIILHNVSEKQSENEEERNKHDREQIKELGKVCKENIKKEDVVKMTRLGKRNPNKPRPLLVQFKDEEKKNGLMQNLANLSKAPEALQKISVQHDLTKKQREDEKEMRECAKKMEAEDESGEFNYRIRGPPWARRIVKMKKRENK